MKKAPDDHELFDLPRSQEGLSQPSIMERADRIAQGYAETAASNFELEKGLIMANELRDRLILVTAVKIRTFIANTSSSMQKLAERAEKPGGDDLLKFIEESLSAYAAEVYETSYKILDLHGRLEIDPLTGLPNRSAYERSLRRGISINERSGETFSYMMIDCDLFKKINDSYGHHAGDQVLQEVARRLSEDVRLREIDTMARYGGEEFVAVLPGTHQKGAAILAERISRQISGRSFEVTDMDGKPQILDVTVSIGIAEYDGWEDDPDGFVVKASADRSLYVLKGQEPDAEGVKQDRRGRIALESRVLEQEEIEAYHKEFDGTTGRVSSRPPVRPSKLPKKD